MNRDRSRRLAWAIALAMVVLGSLLTNGSVADSVTIDSSLPVPRASTGAVWDPTNELAYVLGGRNANLTTSDQILEYDPSTGTVTATSANLSSDRHSLSAVWNGTHAFIFGGRGCNDNVFSDLCERIDRYDPAAGTVTIMGAELPPRYDTSAVWDGQYAYIFGGTGCAGMPCDEIFRYDPATDTVTQMTATLPTPRSGTSAVWDGQYAYIFGGRDCPVMTLPCTPLPLNEIVRYDPATDMVAIMKARLLPAGRTSAAAAWDGGHAYIFGGSQGIGATDLILRYDPAADVVLPMNATLPTPRQAMSTVGDGGGNVYLFGGIGCSENPNNFCDDVLRYHITPGAPLALAVAPGPLPGEVTLAWAPPAPHTYSAPITGYRIYRSATPTAPAFLDQTPGDAHAYTDSTCPGPACHYWVSAVNAVGEGPRMGPALTP